MRSTVSLPPSGNTLPLDPDPIRALLEECLKAYGASLPMYAPIEPDWERISGMKRRKTYEEIARGNLRAIKLGRRTLIDVPHGLAYLRSLPVAKIRPDAAALRRRQTAEQPAA